MLSNSSYTKQHRPICHFDPLLPRIVYVAWLFNSCIPPWDMVPNVKRQYWKYETKNSKVCAIWQIFLAETNQFPESGNIPPLVQLYNHVLAISVSFFTYLPCFLLWFLPDLLNPWVLCLINRIPLFLNFFKIMHSKIIQYFHLKWNQSCLKL